LDLKLVNFSKWTGLKFVGFLKKKKSIGQCHEGEERAERIKKKADLQRRQQEINGLGFFPVNGLGLNLSNFWKEKKLSFGYREKKQ
jgi:hypothetical protein